MAADLELEPKPCHVIAFEDAGDCKNLCCIIQTHMDMLGNGHAFVVPRPPKVQNDLRLIITLTFRKIIELKRIFHHANTSIVLLIKREPYC